MAPDCCNVDCSVSRVVLFIHVTTSIQQQLGNVVVVAAVEQSCISLVIHIYTLILVLTGELQSVRAFLQS